MEIYRDEIEIFVLPDSAKCLAEEEHKNPQEIVLCPLANHVCSGDCIHYSE